MQVQFLISSGPLNVFLEGSPGSDGNFGVERLTFATPFNRVSAAPASGSATIAPAASDAAEPARPKVARTWNFGAGIVFAFPAARLDINRATDALAVEWDSLRATLRADTVTLEFTGLQLVSSLMPGMPLVADATLTFRNASGSTITQSHVVHLHASHRAQAQLQVEANRISLAWTTDLLASLALPGLEMLVEQGENLSLVLSGANSAFEKLELSVTHTKQVIAKSAFAWTRGSDRELLREPASTTPAPEVLEFTVPARSSAQALSLMSLDLMSGGLPVFFGGLGSGSAVQLNVAKFTFPFLRGTHQSIQVETQGSGTGQTLNSSGLLATPLTFQIDVGKPDAALPLEGFSFTSSATMVFDPRKFAFQDTHNAGIPLQMARNVSDGTQLEDNPQLGPRNLLGLTWHFRIAGTDATPNVFLLVTKNSQYQLKLADKVTATAGYARLTRGSEVIEFDSTDFALTEGGLQLTAEVVNKPVLLFGVNTHFRFHDTRLAIVDGGIQDFTLLGTGSLPPKLVGDAAVEAALQFREQDGKLTLVSGGAQLKGLKPLECKPVRFRFTIDALGLKFVDDGHIHFYFTLSGHAQFKLEPGDDPNGPLAALAQIKIPLLEVPLAGTSAVLADHVNFLPALPSTFRFQFLKAFTFELKGFGFLPSVPEFDDDPGIKFSGQMLFSKDNDEKSAKIDFHDILLGLPEDGESFPRLFLRELAVALKYGEAFQLTGTVEFIRSKTESGFKGEGTLQIASLPQIAASFGFVRIREDVNSPFQTAWFVFLEIERIAFQIPEIQLFLREVGLGFGYRFTLAALKGADEETDITKLIKRLEELSKTAGNLSEKDQWVTDLEKPGEDPRWTIALRALFAQTAVLGSPLKYKEKLEAELDCLYMFDAIISFRSDLTFFMNVRAWVTINYNDILADRELRNKPLMTGYVLLQARKKRFLAHVASNPDGEVGKHPELPDFVKQAIKDTEFSATLLIEPGLFHFELGWPNALRWRRAFGPLEIEFRGGFIFRVIQRIRVTKDVLVAQDAGTLITGTVPGYGVQVVDRPANAATPMKVRITWDNPNVNQLAVLAKGDAPLVRSAVVLQGTKDMFPPSGDCVVAGNTFLVVGISFQARAHLEIDEGFDAAVFGAELKASVDVAFGARMTAVTSLQTREVAVYAAISLEIRAKFNLILWVGLGRKLAKEWVLSLSLTITAGLEFGLIDDVGVRGSGTVAVTVMGYELEFSVEFKKNPEIVDRALKLTNDFLVLGLDATDVQPATAALPGKAPAGVVHAPGTVPLKAAASDTPPGGPVQAPGEVVFSPSLATTVALGTASVVPRYTILAKDAGEKGIFILLVPKGEAPETGFLPAPPAENVTGPDFFASFPQATGLRHIKATLDPAAEFASHFEDVANPANATWTANWDADPLQTISARKYLTRAFLVDPNGGLRDPERPARNGGALKDDRVENPTDSSFEAAVRGAFQQFRGSPLFKKDPNNPYDQQLENAFSLETSVYGENGGLPTLDERMVQQVIQGRGLIVHDLIGGFNAYVEAVKQGIRPGTRVQTLPFQMGLVFFLPAGSRPEWLEKPESGLSEAAKVKVDQRMGATAPTAANAKAASTFNIRSANFSIFPPTFEGVRQYTSSNTIAIAWDLEWQGSPAESAGGAQQNPEHHLMNYLVRRRVLDGSEPESVYTVKSARVLNKTKDGLVSQLKPRFQLVDHFNHETVDDQASLPATGRSYLYSVTPIDVGGNAGRPLTLVATRFPDEPPAVPTSSLLTVTYTFDGGIVQPTRAKKPQEAALLLSRQAGTPATFGAPAATVTWQEPSPGNGPNVPIEKYRLIFRRDKTVPVGSYGLDASARGSRSKSLPTSNARPLPTDIQVTLDPTGARAARSAGVNLAAAGIFPSEANPLWRPEAWTVYFQTESLNGVPSPLVPVKLRLRFTTVEGAGVAGRVEERHPAELEFAPQPVSFPVLPAVDQHAIAGAQCVPVPVQAAGTIGTAVYKTHPDGERLIRFRWNQGPSGDRLYPLHLTAGYRLLELDIDANTTDTFTNAGKLAGALRQAQEIQMLPADDAMLSPNDTRSLGLWKAWYPSTLRRLNPPNRPRGSENPLGAWNSWRESTLVWPQWDGFTSAQDRPDGPHPALAAIVAALQVEFTVQVQLAPPMQDGDFATLLRNTAPATDPYGWGVLQAFGLSVTLLLHRADGTLVAGADAVEAIRGVLVKAPTAVTPFLPFLFVELLYQPAKSTSLKEAAVDGKTQLALVQLSVRPKFQAALEYKTVTLPATGAAAKPGDSLDVTFTLTAGAVCTLIDRSDPASGEAQLAGPGTVTRNIGIPASGSTTLLLRCTIGSPPVVKVGETTIVQDTFDARDPASAYFSVPVELLGKKFAAGDAQWLLFKRYAESLSSKPGQDGGISVPADEAGIAKILPKFLAWTNRFFDYSAESATGAGPWTATAYPQSSLPVYVTPDEDGRLTYDYPILDPWAHNYRYYVQPFGRYDVLWQSLRQSRTLFPDARASAAATAAGPDPTKPALDVVLERTKPVATPVVLSSRRLDAPSTAASPAPPGPTWEVIVAQHPEQALAERNQTVFRQLTYRGVAFTMLRRFAFLNWMQSLLGQPTATPLHPAGATPGLPSFPADGPDRLDTDALTPDQVRALALRSRIGDALEGAVVLHWEGLPFFYEHRLLLIAQTDSTVSKLGGVVHGDFEYVSPRPDATFHSEDVQWTLPAPFQQQPVTLRSLKLDVPLKRLWDSLPALAQNRWKNEEPLAADATLRPGGVPDPDVVYQLIESSGNSVSAAANVEMQVELGLEDGVYRARRTGKHYAAQLDAGANPPASPFVLKASLAPIAELTLSRQFVVGSLGNMAAQEAVLLVAGVLRSGDLATLLESNGIRVDAAGRVVETVRSSPALSASLAKKVSYPEIPNGDDLPATLVTRLAISGSGLVWTGSMTSVQRTALRAYRSRVAAFGEAVESVIQALQLQSGEKLSVAYTGRVSTAPEGLGPLTFRITFPSGDNPGKWNLEWHGAITPAQDVSLRALGPATDVELRAAAGRLADTIRDASAALPQDGLVVEPAFSQEVGGAFVAPLADLHGLGQRIGFQLESFFSIRNDRLQCDGDLHNLDVEPADLTARIRTVLDPADPFSTAFSELATLIGQRTYKSDFSGGRLIGAATPLTAEETAELRGLFTTDSDVAAIDALSAALQDRQKLLAFHQGWFSEAAFSEIPGVPATLLPLVDFPDAESCALVWKGPLTAADRTALQGLAGDQGFRDALDDLKPAATGGFSFAQAPLGLDQLPARIKGHVSFSPAGGPFESFTWNSTANDVTLHLTDEVVAVLRNSAQIAEFAAAVSALIESADAFTVPATADDPRFQFPAEVPAGLAGRLQVSATQLALLHTETGDADALQGLIDQFPEGDAYRTKLVELHTLVASAASTPAIVSVASTVNARPKQNQLPDLLKGQLTITQTSVKWTGRVQDSRQLDLLAGLPGDVPFRKAISLIAIALGEFKQEAAFSAAIPARPTQSGLPATLRDRLSLGKFRVRYEGIMSQAEIASLRDAFTARADKGAAERLYFASLDNSRQKRGLALRSRRASAAPSAAVALQPQLP